MVDLQADLRNKIVGVIDTDRGNHLGAGLSAGVRTMSRESPPGVLFMSSAWSVLRGVLGVEGLERFDILRLGFSFV